MAAFFADEELQEEVGKCTVKALVAGGSVLVDATGARPLAYGVRGAVRVFDDVLANTFEGLLGQATRGVSAGSVKDAAAGGVALNAGIAMDAPLVATGAESDGAHTALGFVPVLGSLVAIGSAADACM